MSGRRDPRPPSPCPHLAGYRSNDHGLATPFRSLQRCLRARPPGRAEIRRDPDEVPRCESCSAGPATPSRLYACLACATVSCPYHASAHAASCCAGHDLAVDVDRAELFCCICMDQVYDRDFDAAVVLAIANSSRGAPATAPPPPPPGHRKRRRVDYRPWSPDPLERSLTESGSVPLPAASPASSLPCGLRGFNNLGNTCFMNSVLQALLHTPPLRNYFLSDLHNRYACLQKNSMGVIDGGGPYNNGSAAARVCLACDLDAMYSAVFSGDRMPYSPARFLYSWWKHASNLASYEQQDAHEFFISMLDGIHEKVDDDGQKRSHVPGSGDCCIAHKVFSGILRSEVTCTICGFTSTTYDPCVDISLDLDSSQDASRATASKSYLGSGEADGQRPATAAAMMSTLRGCLERFTRPERLGPDQKFFCQHCQLRQESLKQMSIRKLPLVACFHIKRFEHSSVRKTSRKVDRYLQYPFSLDMAPYSSSSILRGRFGNRIFAFDGGEDSEAAAATTTPEQLSSEFEIFAVVTHSGKLDAGHYITFLRLKEHWFKCDDAWITRVDESIVRASQAYMLFYVQKVLCYRASEHV